MGRLMSDDDYLYKYRTLNDRSVRFPLTMELYYASPTELNDRTELKHIIEVPSSRNEIINHFEDYAGVLKKLADAELLLHPRLKARSENGDFDAFDQLALSSKKLNAYVTRIRCNADTIERLKLGDDAIAKAELERFYSAIRDDLLNSGFFCVSTSGEIDPMWCHYAADHRGVCFEIRNDPALFDSDVKQYASRTVEYTPTGLIHPLEHGYLGTFERIFATKKSDWKFEQEIRLLRFAPPNAVKVKATLLSSIIFGLESLSGKGLQAEQARKEHFFHLQQLVQNALDANKSREGTHRIRFKKLKIVRGNQLEAVEIVDRNQFLQQVFATEHC
jgi:hypothetical protein